MRHLVSLVLVSALTGACGGSAEVAPSREASESDLGLVFVANEGVLVRTDTKKVLIDALFDRPNPAYAAPPIQWLEDMAYGNPPFDGVTLALVTHNHPDHLAPALAGRFLLRNQEVTLVAPEDAVVAIQDSIPNWSDISDRVVSVSLEPGNSLRRNFGGISVTAYRTLHSGQREEPQNLMYLIEMDGRTVFHEGDSDGHPDTFGHFDLHEKHIDLALVHFWFPTNLEAERTLQEILKADHVGLFHLPLNLMAEAPETIRQVSGNYPDMFLLLNSGESRTFRYR